MSLTDILITLGGILGVFAFVICCCVKWNKDDDGNPYGPNGLSISANDLCKIGLLFINQLKKLIKLYPWFV